MNEYPANAVDIVGAIPNASGQMCQAIICQESWRHGRLETAANMIWMKLNQSWYRFFFDWYTLHWRHADEAPVIGDAGSNESEGWSCRNIDLGAKLGVCGLVVQSLTAEQTADAAVLRVEFPKVVLAFQSNADVTRYAIEAK